MKKLLITLSVLLVLPALASGQGNRKPRYQFEAVVQAPGSPEPRLWKKGQRLTIPARQEHEWSCVWDADQENSDKDHAGGAIICGYLTKDGMVVTKVGTSVFCNKDQLVDLTQLGVMTAPDQTWFLSLSCIKNF